MGRAGYFHLPNILAHPSIKLLYIVEALHSRWPKIRRDFKLDASVQFLKPSEAPLIYKDPNVNACLIATPTDTHEGFIADSLQAGKDVLTEKPVAHSIDTVKRLYQIAEQQERILFCAFNRRFDPAFATMCDRVQSGKYI